MADDKQSRSLGKVSTYVYLRSIHISILGGGLSLTINRPITKQYKLPDYERGYSFIGHEMRAYMTVIKLNEANIIRL